MPETINPIQQIHNELAKELDINLSNVDAVLMKLPTLYNQYLQKWYHGSRQIDILEVEMSDMYTELYGYYKSQYEFDLTTAELKSMIENDVTRNKVKLKLQNTKTYVTFIEKCMDNINNTRWTAKSMIDYQNFINGNK